MGRKAEYKNGKTEKELIAEVEERAYKFTLTPKQMATYLSKHSRKQIHFEQRKVKMRVNDICELSNGLIETKDFVKDFNKSNSRYEFKPEWHGLLFALMDTEFFDKRKNDRLLSTRENLYRDLVVNIEFYLEEKDKEVVKSYPGYLNAKCEGIASEAINYQIQSLIRGVMHSDEIVRLRLLRRTHDALAELIEINARDDSRIMSSKMVYKHTFDNTEDGKFIAAMLEAEKLPVFMAELLALKVKGTSYEKLSKEDKLTYPAIYEAAQIDEPVELPAVDDLNKFIVGINNKAEEDTHYQDLMVRVYSVMNMDNPIEKQLFNDFWNVARARFICKKIDKDELEKSKVFFEAAMQHDMYDLFNEFLNGDWNSPVITELQRIQRQTAILSNKIEKDKLEN